MSEPRITDAAAFRVDPAHAGGARKAAIFFLSVGALFTAIALLEDANRLRLGFGYLLGFVFCWSIVLGSLFFVALQHITKSVWSVVLRRVAEMLAAPMWLLAVLFVPIALFAFLGSSYSVFSWANPDYVHGDHLLEDKAPYLNVPFFVVRTALFFLIWIVFAAIFVRKSLKQDTGEAGVAATMTLRKLSAPFLILFALTLTFAGFDWLMSLSPKWFSTIFGVYVFSGTTLASLAAITLGVVWMRSKGLLGQGLVTHHHLYSLGALLFAFTCFWGYIAFSQYMLIWYANLPEETFYFVERSEHGWETVSVLLAFARFAVPFALLLSRGAKTNPRRLALVSLIILFGQLLDLYWIIMPQIHASAPRLGVAEVGPPLLLVGILFLYLTSFMRRHRLVAVGDPLFEKSRDFHL